MTRKLTESEIASLKANGCRCSDWSAVAVSQDFSANDIHRCRFVGAVEIGARCHIEDSTVSDCQIEDDVHILSVGLLRNYKICKGVVIERCRIIDGEAMAERELGTMALINEGGGRPVILSPALTAQTAHILCHYRHRPKLIEQLTEMLRPKVREKAVVYNHACISDTGLVRRVNIGPDAVVSLASELVDGDIGMMARVGTGVIARNFVIGTGSEVTDMAILERTFVGEACQIGKQFSAVDSAFFANCQAFHGEACSLFAGPYTVTHHKSTLLIACQTSFFNAGSATNQSNHLYKLGPLHQGIMERGCKTASSSYMLWPGHIGAFSVVLGHHGKHLNTAALPFSYIVERDGKSYIMPGINLRSVGTWRDDDKWHKRDNRPAKTMEPADAVVSNMLTPYTVGKIVKAMELLNRLKENAVNGEIHYNGCTIKTAAASMGLRLYRLAVSTFAAETAGNSEADDTPVDFGYTDWAGLPLPKNEAEQIISRIEAGRYSLQQLHDELRKYETRYREYASRWARQHLDLGNAEALEADRSTLLDTICDDAQSDFADFTMIGYGIENDNVLDDFRAVRGTAEDNPFLRQLRQSRKD